MSDPMWIPKDTQINEKELLCEQTGGFILEEMESEAELADWAWQLILNPVEEGLLALWRRG